jgi:hypothetical protein
MADVKSVRIGTERECARYAQDCHLKPEAHHA